MGKQYVWWQKISLGGVHDEVHDGVGVRDEVHDGVGVRDCDEVHDGVGGWDRDEVHDGAGVRNRDEVHDGWRMPAESLGDRDEVDVACA